MHVALPFYLDVHCFPFFLSNMCTKETDSKNFQNPFLDSSALTFIIYAGTSERELFFNFFICNCTHTWL